MAQLAPYGPYGCGFNGGYCFFYLAHKNKTTDVCAGCGAGPTTVSKPKGHMCCVCVAIANAPYSCRCPGHIAQFQEEQAKQVAHHRPRRIVTGLTAGYETYEQVVFITPPPGGLPLGPAPPAPPALPVDDAEGDLEEDDDDDGWQQDLEETKAAIDAQAEKFAKHIENHAEHLAAFEDFKGMIQEALGGLSTRATTIEGKLKKLRRALRSVVCVSSSTEEDTMRSSAAAGFEVVPPATEEDT